MNERARKTSTRTNDPLALMTAGDVAKHCGVSISTVRYWAETGKLAHKRTVGGQHIFEMGYVEDFDAKRAKR